MSTPPKMVIKSYSSTSATTPSASIANVTEQQSMASVLMPSEIDGTSSKLSCRFYEGAYPEVNDLVMVTVKQIADMGAYVSLLEYNGVEGMVLLSELSRRRIRSVQRIIRVGKNEVVVVLRVDREKGYIDLSKRRVSPEDVLKFEERYSKSRVVHSILRHVAEKHDLSLEELNRAVAWPLYRPCPKYSGTITHAFDAFKMALTDPAKFWSLVYEQQSVSGPASTPNYSTPVMTLSEELKADIILNIVRRMTPQKVKLRADMEITCFGYEGIEAIKRGIAAGESISTEEFPIKTRLVAPPLYIMNTQCLDKTKGIEAMNEAISKMDAILKTAGGSIVVKVPPKTVNEKDDRDLEALMHKLEMDNADVSGDEDNSE